MVTLFWALSVYFSFTALYTPKYLAYCLYLYFLPKHVNEDTKNRLENLFIYSNCYYPLVDFREIFVQSKKCLPAAFVCIITHFKYFILVKREKCIFSSSVCARNGSIKAQLHSVTINSVCGSIEKSCKIPSHNFFFALLFAIFVLFHVSVLKMVESFALFA